MSLYLLLKYGRIAALAGISIFLISCAGKNIFAEMTNAIPVNVFLMDDGLLFLYKSGERVVDVRKIEAAKKSHEVAPADQDPDDNWGAATNGFQLSLRLEKAVFTNGEAVVATPLMRNVTGKDQTYYRPIKFIMTEDGKALKRKDDGTPMEINMLPIKSVYPQTQNKSKEILSDIYDLSEAGRCGVQALSRWPYVTSQIVEFSVTKSAR